MRSMPRPFRRLRPQALLALWALVLALAVALVTPPRHAQAADTLLSQGKPATASSSENAGTAASNAVDGNTGTRWSSAFSDPQWLQVDLGSSVAIDKVVLNWEAAYASAYQIQVSANGTSWTNVYSTTTGAGGTETLTVSGTGRYVRVYGTARHTGYGYSLWEFQVYGPGGGTTPPPGGGDLGPNVKVFDPSMSSGSIQSQLDSIFSQQESNQFGSQRYALLFKPGSYNVNANIGFYTSIAGLGRNVDDVNINGAVNVDAGWFGGNATQNFWRSAENLSVTPTGGQDRWAVAQAAPFRRMHIRGDLRLEPSGYGWASGGYNAHSKGDGSGLPHSPQPSVTPTGGQDRWAVAQAAPFRRMHIRGDLRLEPSGYGWASGGYIADSKVDGSVLPYSQQQWLTRDSQIGGWGNGVWNMVFSGVS